MRAILANAHGVAPPASPAAAVPHVLRFESLLAARRAFTHPAWCSPFTGPGCKGPPPLGKALHPATARSCARSPPRSSACPCGAFHLNILVMRGHERPRWPGPPDQGGKHEHLHNDCLAVTPYRPGAGHPVQVRSGPSRRLPRRHGRAPRGLSNARPDPPRDRAAPGAQAEAGVLTAAFLSASPWRKSLDLLQHLLIGNDDEGEDFIAAYRDCLLQHFVLARFRAVEPGVGADLCKACIIARAA
mgnify:CR=1 FL=1